MIYAIRTNNNELRQRIYDLGYYDETMDLPEDESFLYVEGQDMFDSYLSNMFDEEFDEVEIYEEDEVEQFLEVINSLD